jgi:hypothetical protein
VGLWTTQERCPQAPQAQQQQQKRTFDVLQTADIFTRSGQRLIGATRTRCGIFGPNGTRSSVAVQKSASFLRHWSPPRRLSAWAL